MQTSVRTSADLDGDGLIEIAWVDRPHLARSLQVWRVRPLADGSARLDPVADLSGLTNHKIGWDHIDGGLRDCGQGPELVLADAEWRRVMAVTLGPEGLSARALGAYAPGALAAALACD